MQNRAWSLVVCWIALAGCSTAASHDAGTDAARIPLDVDPGGDGARQDVATATDVALDVEASGCAMPDLDHDGHRSIACGGDDCDDTDPHRFPGNPEVCAVGSIAVDGGTRLSRVAPVGDGGTLDPGHDEDCDPTTFAGGLTGDGDHDGDHYVDVACCNTDRNGMSNCGTDCQDLDNVAGVPAVLMTSVRPGDIHPMQSEVCDGVDNNCNGQVDEGVEYDFYPDCDGDGYGDMAATGMSGCTGTEFPTCMGNAPVNNHSDCDDTQASVNPGTPEVCDAAMVDENCNGMHNEGCHCNEGDSVACGSALPGCPQGTETCVGRTLSACPVSPVFVTCYADADGDGYPRAGAATSTACTCPAHTTLTAPGAATIDCNDGNATVHPHAAEVCNAIDDDCDGSVDNFPGSQCAEGSAITMTTCGQECTQTCDATCHPSCTCNLARSSWSWNGSDPTFSHTMTYSCAGTNSGAAWVYTGDAGPDCNAVIGPTSPGITLPPGSYNALVTVTGNLQGDVYVYDAGRSILLTSYAFDLRGAGGFTITSSGQDLITVPFSVSECSAIWVVPTLRMNPTVPAPRSFTVQNITIALAGGSSTINVCSH